MFPRCLPLLLSTPLLVSLGAPDAGDDAYRYLAGLLDKGLYAMAVEEGESFLSEHADHPKAELARYRLATALFELDRRTEAAPHYASLVDERAFEYRAEAAFRLGQCHLTAGELEAARRRFDAVLRLDQDYLHAPALFFRADAEFRGGEHGRAEASYAALLERHPASEYADDARRARVWCAWEQGRATDTVERAREALRAGADDEAGAEIALVLGEALLELERADEALAAFDAIASPRLADARLRGIGFAQVARGDHAAAARAFAQLLQDHGDGRHAEEARLQLGIALLELDDAERAVRTLTPFGANGAPSDPEALYWLAEAQAANGQHERAVNTLRRARRGPVEGELDTRLGVALGEALTELGRADEALAAFESAGSDYALYAAAVAGWNERDTTRAIELAQRLERTHPQSEYVPGARQVLGEALLAEERFEEARVAFDALAASDAEPELVAAALNRGAWCRYRAGALQEAARGWADLLQRFPDSSEAPEASALRVHALLEGERTEEALRAGQRHLERWPRGPRRDQVLLATARAARGQDDALAARRLRELVDRHAESALRPRALFELGELLSAAGRHEDAADAYGRVLREHGASAEVAEAGYGLAWCLLELGRPAEGARELERVGARADLSPDMALATQELAVWAWSQASEPERAGEAWQRLARLTRDDARRFRAARNVVAAWRDAGRPARGQGVLDDLLRLAEDEAVRVKVLLEGAYLALEEGDVDRAEAQVEVARQRAGSSATGTAEVAEASFFVGQARWETGQPERALGLYRNASAKGSPVRAEASYRLGFALLDAQDPRAAARAFGIVVNEHEGSELWGESLFLLGESFFRAGDLEAAASAMERLRREAPEHEVLPRALFRLGLAQGRLERWPACEATLNELARRAPEFENLAEAELWRGRALAAQRKRRAARAAFERVVGLDRGELAARARLGLGLLLEEENRTEEALAEYLKVALLYAHEEEVAEALVRAGGCLEASGDVETARAQYDEVLAKYPNTAFAAQARRAAERL